ncbi:MAG: hypothetical protein SPJ34_03145 [Candidatus Ornithospirochaeta sp.]|nr:hypothetical protein [Candidatus Ornithospirochaeta sp.]
MYIRESRKIHPSYTMQDAVKQVYQSVFLSEHALSGEAERLFMEEYDSIEPSSLPLYERIGKDAYRIDMRAWKALGLKPEWLFRLFLLSSKESNGSVGDFIKALREADTGFEGWNGYVESYLEGGVRAVHHSAQYRDRENPHYRVVGKTAFSLVDILSMIGRRDRCTIAIDGPAASGKTTLASALSFVLDADAIHMDDFFLPPEIRTEERLSEKGGNVHYERFMEEVIPFLGSSLSFSYRIFDCSLMDYNGARTIRGNGINVIEGSYSCHPRFRESIDIKVFLKIDRQLQLERIAERDGKEALRAFVERWIPYENAYFEEYSIESSADIVKPASV